MNMLPVHKLSRASQFSLVAIVILLGGVFFTVNGALQQQQNVSSHASTAGIVSGYTYRFVNKCSTQSMDVSNNSQDNTANIIQWSWNTGGWNNDREWIVRDLGNGYYSIQAFSSQKYLDVYQNGTGDGVQLIQWSGDGSPTSRYNEQFQIVALGNGYYKILGRNSGKAIGLYACNNSEGLNIRQYTYDGSSRLQWQLLSQLAPQPTAAPTTVPVQSGGNLITNPSFENGTTDWYLNQVSPGVGSFTTTTAAEDGVRSALVTITGSSTNNWYVQLNHGSLPLQSGQKYTVSYWAKASSSRQIEVAIQDDEAPWTIYGDSNPTITTSWQYYTFSFTAPTADTVALRFNLANNTGSVWIDNVSYSTGSTTSPTATPVPPTSAALPPAPTGLTATPGNGKVTLNWDAISGDYYYIYERNVTAGETSFTKLPYPVTTNTFTYTPIPNGQTFQFKVSAIGTNGVEGPKSAAVSATPTASSPTSVPSSQPTSIPTTRPTAIPTQVPQPTDTPVPGSTVLAINVGLHGVGNGGDSASPGSQGNMNPQRPSRTVTADVYDSQNQLVVSQQGTITYQGNSGRFNGIIDLGTNFQSGPYTVKIKTDQYLRALVPGIQTITAGQTNTLPDVTLVAGDINNDNAINIVDYNILIGCYSDLLPATNCSATDNVLADITDDGHVNQFDYNLFLRELTNIGGE